MNKVKLYIPICCARNAKLNGATYDKDTKTWYCDINDQLCFEYLQPHLEVEVIVHRWGFESCFEVLPNMPLSMTESNSKHSNQDDD
jgi:hypothetical protein